MSEYVYVLIYQENSDCGCNSDVFVFVNQKAAQEKMEDCYNKSLKALGHRTSIQKDDYRCWLDDEGAAIVEGMDSFDWRIETHKVL